MSEEQQGDGLDSLRLKLASETARADAAEGRLKDRVLTYDLESTARKAGAFNASQVVALLKPKGVLQPAVNKDGDDIPGEFNVFLQLDNGETVPPQVAIARCRDENQNLFYTREQLVGADDEKFKDETPMQRASRLARTNVRQFREERTRLLGVRKHYGRG